MLSEKAEEIVDKVAQYIRENRRLPSRKILSELGITKDSYRNQFVTIESMVAATYLAYPELKDSVITADDIFNPDYSEKVSKSVEKYKRFVITTAVTGMPVDEKFYASIKNYCAVNDALLLILPTSDPAAALGFELDGLLVNDCVVVSDIMLNENLKVSTFKTSAKQINTLTGLRRVGQRECSMIVASPKQFLEFVPTHGLIPHALMTTGSITTPEYLSTDRYMSMRTAWLANNDHKMGAIIVEIVDNKRFHFRRIEGGVDGSFTDLGITYEDLNLEKVRPEAIVLGDIHVGSIDRNVYKTTNKILKKMKPRRVFFHDLFDGISINPHASMSHLTKASMAAKLDLEAELKVTASYLNRMREKHPYVEEWIIVRSNHDIFLDRYLNSGDYIKEPHNAKIAHKLASRTLDGDIPLVAGLDEVGLTFEKLTFLNLDESYVVQGYECGAHGHLGSNGVRNPSNAALEVAYGKGVFGHSHTGGILRDIVRVGTSTRLKLGYNHGASSWTHSLAVIYPDGSCQLVNDINGEWRANDI